MENPSHCHNYDDSHEFESIELNETRETGSAIIAVSNVSNAVENNGGTRLENQNMSSEATKKSKNKNANPESFGHHVTNFVHFSTFLFVFLIVYLCFRAEVELFTWHPLLLSVGWMLLMTEGILTLRKEKSFLHKIIGTNNRIFYHWLLLGVGSALVLVGFAIVYIGKNLKSKEHFQTWHGFFGVISVGCATTAVINGVATLYHKEIKNLIHPKINKLIHIASGTMTYSFGGLTLILSVYSKWFANRSDGSYVTFAIGLSLVLVVVVWTSIKPYTSIIRRVDKLLYKERDV